MRGLSQELVIVLIFGAILLAQFLYKQLRRKAASMQEEIEAEVPPAAAASTPAPTDTTARPAAARMAALTPAPTRVAPRSRRYSRAALMPDRRAVQNAIVIAAILQPCHANRARDIE